jgi:hypothetical protein
LRTKPPPGKPPPDLAGAQGADKPLLLGPILAGITSFGRALRQASLVVAMNEPGDRPLGAKRTEGKGKPAARLQFAKGLPRDPFAKISFEAFYAGEDTPFELCRTSRLTDRFLEGRCPDEEVALACLGHLGIPLSESPVASADEEAFTAFEERIFR